ncbi:MAG TPA: B12-binding domain-containing protein [Gaiellaceae bacterium]|nr:B12-binding domain-containing protein [Gaiellaceae bacterium]
MVADLRIGELSRRTGVSPELLRAWERRYDLLQPVRSSGGYRLYSAADEQRVRTMTGGIARGLSAGEAAKLALVDGLEAPSAATLVDALVGFDDVGAHAALDRLLSSFTVESVIGDSVLPALRELGERWQRGEITIGQEHFASNLLRGRMLGLARGWDRGSGPRALLACPSGELHDLSLIAFGLALREHGWRITYLGADTPLATIDETATSLHPELILIAAADASRLSGHAGALKNLAERFPLALAGAGADEALAKRIGARHLSVSPVDAAAIVAAQN